MEFSGRYIRLYEQVTGQEFERQALGEPVRARVEANLRRAFPEFFAASSTSTSTMRTFATCSAVRLRLAMQI